jgi:hypothetical protein
VIGRHRHSALTSIRALAASWVGSKRIAATLAVARNTAKRYLRTSVAAGEQERPHARKLSTEARAMARTLYEGVAEANAVVVIGGRALDRADADRDRLLGQQSLSSSSASRSVASRSCS